MLLGCDPPRDEQKTGNLDACDQPVDDDEVVVTQLWHQRLKDILDAETALEVRMIDVVPDDRMKIDELVFELDQLTFELGDDTL